MVFSLFNLITFFLALVFLLFNKHMLSDGLDAKRQAFFCVAKVELDLGKETFSAICRHVFLFLLKSPSQRIGRMVTQCQ